MDELLVWLIASLIKAIFRKSRDDDSKLSTSAPQTRREERSGRLRNASQVGQSRFAVKMESVAPASKSGSNDVWEEYRKKQEALHRAHESKAPKS